MEALIEDHDIKGAELMTALRNLLGPEVSIGELLDAARLVNTKRYAGMLRAMNFETIFDLVGHMADNWGLNVEDIEDVLRHMTADPHIKALLDAGLVPAVLKFAKKDPEPTGCFTWVACKRRR